MLKHGEVYPFVFELTGDKVKELFSDSGSEADRLRIDVSWKDEPGVTPSVMLILKSPEGYCSEPETEGRAADPFPFHLNSTTPCNEAPFGDTLINAFINGTHRPAKYNFGEPLIKILWFEHRHTGRGSHIQRAITKDRHLTPSSESRKMDALHSESEPV